MSPPQEAEEAPAPAVDAAQGEEAATPLEAPEPVPSEPAAAEPDVAMAAAEVPETASEEVSEMAPVPALGSAIPEGVSAVADPESSVAGEALVATEPAFVEVLAPGLVGGPPAPPSRSRPWRPPRRPPTARRSAARRARRRRIG